MYIVKCDYTRFLDSDDWIYQDMYEALDDICNNSCDIANYLCIIHFKNRIKINGDHYLIIYTKEEE